MTTERTSPILGRFGRFAASDPVIDAASAIDSADGPSTTARTLSRVPAVAPLRVVGFGAGGHARVVIDILRLLLGYSVVALFDPDPKRYGTLLDGVPIQGDDEQAIALHVQGVRLAFIGLGGTDRHNGRRALFHKVKSLGFDVVDAVHPSATISPTALAGVGLTIMAGAVINAGATLGDDVIVNTGAIVEHDCVIGDHVHIATRATLAGGVVVAEGAHIGAGAVVRQGITIGPDAVIGAGAVVVKDVRAGTVVVGNPARVLRTL